MKICARCLYHEYHPLRLTFDEERVCSGCRIHEEKDQLNWRERGEKLKRILEQYRCRSGNNYDCVLPVSGARDSFFIVHLVKKVYGMNPLLVTYNKQYSTAVGVRNLARLRIHFDCDIMTMTVNPDIVRKITRATLRRFGSIYWHCLAGQTVFPVQIAVKFKIPLIIWGLHQGVDQVGMFSHLHEVEMTRKYRKEHDLMGYESEDLVDSFDGITLGDIEAFSYPDNREVERVGVRGIYLNNYVRWNSRKQHEAMLRRYAYETAVQTRTFDAYNDVDCWNYSDVHDYLKWLKHGYGKVVDHACREIRLKQMTRAEGIRMVEKYQSRFPANLPRFLDWIGMKESAFQYLTDQHRNAIFWNRGADWEWSEKVEWKRKMKQAGKPACLFKIKTPFQKFKHTPKRNSTDTESHYILIGKGWKSSS